MTQFSAKLGERLSLNDCSFAPTTTRFRGERKVPRCSHQRRLDRLTDPLPTATLRAIDARAQRRPGGRRGACTRARMALSVLTSCTLRPERDRLQPRRAAYPTTETISPGDQLEDRKSSGAYAPPSSARPRRRDHRIISLALGFAADAQVGNWHRAVTVDPAAKLVCSLGYSGPDRGRFSQGYRETALRLTRA